MTESDPWLDVDYRGLDELAPLRPAQCERRGKQCPVADIRNAILEGALPEMRNGVRYWLQGDSVQNFGYYLSEFFVEELFYPPLQGVKRIHIIGSVIDDMFVSDFGNSQLDPSKNTVSWGCGIREPGQFSQISKQHSAILSVRGPLSAMCWDLARRPPKAIQHSCSQRFMRQRKHRNLRDVPSVCRIFTKNGRMTN